MTKKRCLKHIEIFIITFLLFVSLASIGVESTVYSAEEGTYLFISDSNKNATSGAFDGYSRFASTLLIVIALIIATIYVLKKKYGIKTSFGRGNKRLHVIDHISLGVKKSVFLVKVPGKHLLIGVTNDRIELISEISNEDVGETEAPAIENTDKSDFLSLMKRSYLEKKQK